MDGEEPTMNHNPDSTINRLREENIKLTAENKRLRKLGDEMAALLDDPKAATASLMWIMQKTDVLEAWRETHA